MDKLEEGWENLNLSITQKNLLKENAKKKLDYSNEELKKCIKEQPKISEKLEEVTKTIASSKSKHLLNPR
jgi:hypothetical protein